MKLPTLLLCVCGLAAAPAHAAFAVLPSAFCALDGDPAIAARIDKLEAHVARKGKEDTEAIARVDELAHDFAAAGPKDRTAIVAAVADAVRSPRRRPDKQTFDDRLAKHGADALGDFGEPGWKGLADLLEDRELRKNLPLLEVLLEASGRTRAKKALPVLIDYVTRRDVPAIRGAARGLAHFADAEGALRKQGFEAAFKTLIYIHDELANEAVNAPSREQYWHDVGEPLVATLAALSKHEEAKVDGWQRWWNDNKNKDWDAAK